MNMIYYRLAYQKSQVDSWIWKTTVLTSLPTVFQWLRIYGSFPQDQIRVFSAPAKEDLEEMLQRENCGWPSGSVTAEQFLRDRHMQVHPGTQNTSKQETTEQKTDLSTAFSPEYENSTILFPPNERGMDSLDRKRLEIEQGAGGDHDVPYHFTLPIFMPQQLAWIRLQNRVSEEVLRI
jgi:hypothetical protein